MKAKGQTRRSVNDAIDARRKASDACPLRLGDGEAGRCASGEAVSVPISDEAACPRRRSRDAGPDLLTRVLARDNLQRAWKRVKANRGAAGVDGLDIASTGAWLRTAWPELCEQLRQGTYRPRPVRRVSIPKPGGGERELGIPTVADRLIQQALLQVLQPLIDPYFSDHSHGFRPGRSAHDAVLNAQRHVQAGYRVVVDVDLERFFDHVGHDILMAKLAKYVADRAVLRLIRAYLDAGVLVEGVCVRRHEGTPQGGPLSPLLANVMLDGVDRELERRGLRFERYADDCNIYVRSQRAGQRVLASLRRLYGRLHLQMNEAKTSVRSAFGAKFLGYALWAAPGGEVKRAVAAKAVQAYRRRVRQLTRRSSARSMSQVIDQLRDYVRGWKAYFRLAQTPGVWRTLDEALRHRLRAIQLKHWKRGTTIYREALKLGASPTVARQAASGARHWWRGSGQSLNGVLTIAYFDRLGAPRLC